MERAGIYVIVALAHDCATCAITRDQAPDCYPVELKTQGQAVINEFAKYPNVLAFSAGNEVNHFAPPSFPEWNAPCQKQFIRDMRAYVSSCSNLRHVPIGLISADSYRDELALYYNCQSNPNDDFEAAEWYGINTYVSCDAKVQKYEDALGFQLLRQSFAKNNYSIPVLLTEFGCISESFPTVDGVQGQRNFLQAKWLLEEETLRDSFSGGFAFEYSIEKANARLAYPFKVFGLQNFGIGYFGPARCNDVNIPCAYHPFPSYDSLKQAYTMSNISVTTTRDTFEVSTYRQGRSKCPDRFPAPDSFTWETDEVSDLKCPARGQASNFVCPATKTIKKPDTSPLLDIFFVVTIVTAVLLTVLLVAAIIIKQYRKKKREKTYFYTVTMPSSNKDVDEGDSRHSDESTGLLAMQTYQAGGGEYYHDIQSDSSSEDLRVGPHTFRANE
jgi:hypothetical protein